MDQMVLLVLRVLKVREVLKEIVVLQVDQVHLDLME